ncbi:hypothetical protein [Pseudomonas faucium]|uniref:hypothetical protein n=1 Tax=Pseudomonas faucium TaxID=2740518 RepID=UPI001F2FA51C|nr:hypothetical protein [Pseudomonas faucium]
MKMPVWVPALLSMLWLTGCQAAGSTASEKSPVKPQGAAIITPDVEWSAWQKESASDLKCGDSKVLVGREHRGDEHGNSRIRCATVIQFELLKTFNETRHDPVQSRNFNFTCPSPKVMIGRFSEGDENGTTGFYCVEYKDSWGDVLIPSETQTIQGKESDHQLLCNTNEVVIGSSHVGDENATTTYRCAQLF